MPFFYRERISFMKSNTHLIQAAHGAALTVYQTGGGKPLLLLHGNGETSATYDAVLPALSSAYTVYRMDTRGHGDSTHGSAPLSYALFADDVLTVLDALALPSVCLVGFSDGAITALYAALKDQQRFSALVLCGANLLPAGLDPAVLQKLTYKYQQLKAASKADPALAPTAELFDLMVHHPNIPPEALSSLSLPALVLAGERDMVLPQHTRLIAESLPKAQLSILPDADHFFIEKQPEAFLSLLTPFLSHTL